MALGGILTIVDHFSVLPKYSDTIVTVVLIVACIVIAVFVVVFVSLQIYAESIYLVQVISLWLICVKMVAFVQAI